MTLFYQPDITPVSHILDEEESKHGIRVLRLKTGDPVLLTDGKGQLAQGVIASDHPKKCRIDITQIKHYPRRKPYSVHLAIAPTKNISRFEWFLEKATEIGIDSITPLYTSNSERRSIKPERLQKVLIAAMKQSVKAFLPILNEAVAFRDFIRAPLNGARFIAYVSDQHTQSLASLYKAGSDANILIGPEGDFSPDEIQLAIDQKFQPVSLGDSRLRTETAGIVACHTLALLNEP